jgi:DNA/RNA endonuclease YhcR with UshA esterase domain
VTNLIPLYAIGVFTSFTLSQASMTRRHLRLREPGWHKGIAINGFGGALSFVVAVIVAVTKFPDGAWAILVALPILVVLLLRVHRQYETERTHLEEDVPKAAVAPILRRHVVLVFIDKLDLATARAIQYARTLTPDELRAVHFAVDPAQAEELRAAWAAAGMHRVTLDLVDCPDRRLERAAVELVATDLADGDTEVSVLLPDRKYTGLWHRILHDRTADAIERAVSQLAHANVTTVPFHFDETGKPARRRVVGARRQTRRAASGPERPAPSDPVTGPDGLTPLGDVRWRQQVTVEGTVSTLRVDPVSGSWMLECVIGDGTGALSLVFNGRRQIAGLALGTHVRAQGMVAEHRGRLAIFNPVYSLLISRG